MHHQAVTAGDLTVSSAASSARSALGCSQRYVRASQTTLRRVDTTAAAVARCLRRRWSYGYAGRRRLAGSPWPCGSGWRGGARRARRSAGHTPATEHGKECCDAVRRRRALAARGMRMPARRRCSRQVSEDRRRAGRARGDQCVRSCAAGRLQLRDGAGRDDREATWRVSEGRQVAVQWFTAAHRLRGVSAAAPRARPRRAPTRRSAPRWRGRGSSPSSRV